jgi:hypothetical protein
MLSGKQKHSDAQLPDSRQEFVCFLRDYPKLLWIFGIRDIFCIFSQRDLTSYRLPGVINQKLCISTFSAFPAAGQHAIHFGAITALHRKLGKSHSGYFHRMNHFSIMKEFLPPFSAVVQNSYHVKNGFLFLFFSHTKKR